MSTLPPFAPLTRNDVAKIMKKCVRTLDNWGAEGVMPMPAFLGGSCYWHPDVFYGWLDATLRGRAWDHELALQAAPGKIMPFEPLTREEAAKIMQKSVRTLENWCTGGLMPRPVPIGGTCYWHPAIFYAWLDAKLKGQASPPAAPGLDESWPHSPSRPAPEAMALVGQVRRVGGDSKPPKKSGGTGRAARARARDAALLQAMNAL